MTTPAADRLTQVEYAQLRGYSPQYVSKLKKQQRLVLDADGLVLVAQTDAVIAALRDPARGGDRTGKRAREQAAPAPAADAGAARAREGLAPATGGAAADRQTYAEAATQEKLERTRLLQLEIAEKSGQLLRRDQVEAEAFRRGRQALEALMAMKDRLCGRLAAETDPLKVEAMLDDEIRRAARIIASGGEEDEAVAA